MASPLTVRNLINTPVAKAWDFYTLPEHVMKWNNASAEWHTPKAENDLRVGGNFLYRMEAKDGSFGFDFAGTYDHVKTHELISYSLGNKRKVKVQFTANGANCEVVVTFDAESTHSLEMQQTGWQSILDNYKKYTETN